RLVLLLVSADFMASDYCHTVEVKRALERHEKGEARVVPVLLRPCDWESAPFGKLGVLPDGGVPISTARDQDAALTEVAKAIRSIVEQGPGAGTQVAAGEGVSAGSRLSWAALGLALAAAVGVGAIVLRRPSSPEIQGTTPAPPSSQAPTPAPATLPKSEG